MKVAPPGTLVAIEDIVTSRFDDQVGAVSQLRVQTWLSALAEAVSKLGSRVCLRVVFRSARYSGARSAFRAGGGPLHLLGQFVELTLGGLALQADCVHFHLMVLTYPINFIGHDKWMQSGYDPRLSQGDVITRDGEIIGCWRVVGYDPNDEYSAGRFEFLALGEDAAKFQEDFAMLDIRIHRGFALSTLTKTIREWYETNNPTIS